MLKLLNLTIRKRLIYLGILVFFLVSILTLTGWIGFRTINQKNTIAALLERQTVYLNTMTRGLGEHVLSDGAPFPLKLVKEGIGKFDETDRTLSPLIEGTDIYHEMREKVMPKWEDIKKRVESFLMLKRIGPGNDEAMVKYGGLSADGDLLLNEMQSIADNVRKRADSDSKKIIRLISGIAIVIMLMLSLLLISTYRAIIRPIDRINNTAEKMASGDLTTTVEIKGNDEIASLGMAINRMASNLKDMLTKIKSVTDSVSGVTEIITLSSGKVLSGANAQNEAIEKTASFIDEIDNSISSVALASDSLAASSEQASSSIVEMATSIERVAESANVFSANASDAASSIEEMVASMKEIAESLELISSSSEETASSITEINAAVKEVESSAAESVSLAEHVTEEASEKGMKAANAAINGMEEVKTSVGAIAEVINRLGKRSEEIGQILNVIEEVADETNLLALNAAILAAQAGEHGKGFAVVAGEIKSLAGKTSLSTKEIAALIKSVQSETRASVEMADTGIKSVEKGVKLVKEVNVALKSILDSSTPSTEKAKLIQRAATEQSKAIKDITKAISSMSEQIEHISKATKEQSKGSSMIIESIGKIKELAHHVKKATSEQSIGSKQISETIENVSLQAEQIAGATSKQREKSKEIVKAIENIKKIAGESVSTAGEMNSFTKVMEEEAKTLLAELQRFKV